MKLISIKQSTKADKKLMATFENDGRTKTIHFGSKGMDDFTKTRDEEQKKRYLARHRANENWNKPDSAGALSRWILWNKPTLEASINDYKKKFNLT